MFFETRERAFTELVFDDRSVRVMKSSGTHTIKFVGHRAYCSKWRMSSRAHVLADF